MRVKLFACGLMSATIDAVHLTNHNRADVVAAQNNLSAMPMLAQTSDYTNYDEHFLAQEDSFAYSDDTLLLPQVSEEDKSLSAQMFKYYNVAMDAIYGMGCRFTGCLEPTPMELAKMWHLMKAHRKRTKITKITPTWPSPQLAVPAAPPAPAPEPEQKQAIAKTLGKDKTQSTVLQDQMMAFKDGDDKQTQKDQNQEQ